jgi:hypothetical protein
METKLHGAFEFVCAESTILANEILHMPYITNNIFTFPEHYDIVTLHSKGEVTFENIETNERVTYTVGDFHPLDNKMKPGNWRVIFDNDFEYFCISPTSLSPTSLVDYAPITSKISPFKLMANESIEIEQGKKLFLAIGSLNIGDKNYSGTNRIKFTSGNKTVTAMEDSYGFFINI